MKEKQPSFDVIRAVSTAAIVLFHYSFTFIEYQISGSHVAFLKFASGDWGGVFVAVFFMLSGAAIQYNWGDRIKKLTGRGGLLDFYRRRWLAIFPMFYIAWTVMYIINSRKLGTWYWGGLRRKFLLTFLGMDGYFMDHGINYYCLGEWFLGGIIFVYLFYPLFRVLFSRFRCLSTVMLTAVFIFNLYRTVFSSLPDTNLFIVLIKYYNSHIIMPDSKCLWTCFMDFWTGMLLVTYRKKIVNRWTAAAGLAVFIVFLIFPMPFSEIAVSLINAAAVFIMLSYITDAVSGRNAGIIKKMTEKCIKYISRYSYGIFLVHHVILYAIMQLFKGKNIGFAASIGMFILIFLIIAAAGMILTEAADALLAVPGRLNRMKNRSA